MSFGVSLMSVRAYTYFRISTHGDYAKLKFHVRVPSRTYSNENRELENDPPAKFPSFSTKAGKRTGTNFEGFVSDPPLSVFSNTILQGVPNNNNIAPKILKNFNQSQNELLTGTSFAIESVTKEISSQRLDSPDDVLNSNDGNDGTILEQCLTSECHYRLRNCCLSMHELQNKHHLVNTPKDDIFFSWIHSLKVDEFGSTLMKVCTLSFPQYSFIVNYRNERKAKLAKFHNDMKMKNIQHPEEIQKRVNELNAELLQSIDGRGYKPREYIRSHDIVVSNFLFKCGPETDDSWLIDDIMMRNSADVYSRLKYQRWKGRMTLCVIGFKFRHIFILDCGYFGMFTAFLGGIV